MESHLIDGLTNQELDNCSEDHLWLMGGCPDGGVLNKGQYPVWQTNYLDLLAMRDLPAWGLPAKPQVTQRFFKMLAALHGHFWNASQIGKSLGLSYHTVNTYLDYLEQTFLIRRVSPYSTNLKKRVVKTPKVYWRDSGLLHALSNIPIHNTLLMQPWVGNSWEGWIMEQMIIHLENKNIPFDGPYYLRTAVGEEIDCIFIISGLRWAIEIKLTSSPGQSDLKKLLKTSQLIEADRTVLISRTADSTFGSSIISTDIKHFLQYLSTI